MNAGGWLENFIVYCGVALSGILMRGAKTLGESLPPFEDPVAFKKWRARQLLIALGEIISLPAFGVTWLAVESYFNLAAPVLIFGCLISGALGFGFWLAGFQRIANRKMDNV